MSNTANTEVTKLENVAALPYAPTAFESTAAAPSSRAPKPYDKARKIAEIRAMLAGRLDAFEAS